MTYLELKKLRDDWKNEVCIFGAGKIGKGMAYDIITMAGFLINFYCDNKVKPGTVIRNGIEVRDIQYLYDNADKTVVFIGLGVKFQNEVVKQLRNHDVSNIIIVDKFFLSDLLDSIDSVGDDIVKKQYHSIYDNVEFLRSEFEKHTCYKLNIENPKTFNEKLQWLKLYNHKLEYIKMVDKYGMKEYVRDKIGDGYTIPTLGVWDSFDEIDFDKLPKQFVLKCTHDSGSIVIVEDKDKLDKEDAKRKLNTALKVNYYWMGREWPYRGVRRRIIAEPYIEDVSNMIDYKFMCFDGNVRSIFTCSERFDSDGLKVTFFDLDWNKMPFERHYPTSKKYIPKPLNFEKMLEYAQILSEGIPFIRVDFYEIKGQVYVGEFTFFPGGGMEEFEPQEWDGILGDWIQLPKKNYIDMGVMTNEK